MSITFKKTVAVFAHDTTIEEAETLLQWLVEKPNRKVNLKALQHAHTVVIQVLMATRPHVSNWPSDGPLSQLLRQHMQRVA